VKGIAAGKLMQQPAALPRVNFLGEQLTPSVAQLVHPA
jgi:hypothetical protein